MIYPLVTKDTFGDTRSRLYQRQNGKKKVYKEKKIVFNGLEKLRMSRAARQLRGKTRITFHEVGDLISFYVYCRYVFLF